MTGSRRIALQTLAEQAASKIGFTLRRWWQDAANPSVLRVEVERRMIGAPPAIGELKVPVQDHPSQRRKQSSLISARPRTLRRRQSASAASSSSRQQRVPLEKRKTAATKIKAQTGSQRKTTKVQTQGKQDLPARARAATRPAGARKRQS